MKKIIVGILVIVIIAGGIMLARELSMQNDKVSIADTSTTEVIAQEEEISAETYMPTEKEVLDKFNSYLEFADKWIYNYDDNYVKSGFYTDDEGEHWAYVNDNEYKTAEALKSEIRKYFESGYPVEFLDKAQNINGRICYHMPAGCGRGGPIEFEDVSVSKLNDGTFEINYRFMEWDPNEPIFFIYDKVLHYRPNTQGEWFFYESKSSICTSWEIYFEKYLKKYCNDCNTFCVTDFDKDGIPEAILYSSDRQQYESRIIGYNVNYPSLYLERDVEFFEIENSDYICKTDTNGNYIKSVVYGSDGAVLWEGSVIENEGKKTYYSDHQQTTMLEYMNSINKYCPESKRKSLERYDFNQENFDKYLFGYCS